MVRLYSCKQILMPMYIDFQIFYFLYINLSIALFKYPFSLLSYFNNSPQLSEMLGFPDCILAPIQYINPLSTSFYYDARMGGCWTHRLLVPHSHASNIHPSEDTLFRSYLMTTAFY